MVSPSWWTWVWISSGSRWWTGRPGMPACLAWDCKESDMTEWLNWTENHDISILDSSVLLFVSAFLSFLLLGAIHCMNISCEFNSLFSHSSIDGYLSYFKFQFSSVTQSVKLSNFFFKETTCFFYYFILFYLFIFLVFFSKVAVPFYIPINSVWELQLLHVLANVCWLLVLFCFCHSGWYVVVDHCGFHLHFPDQLFWTFSCDYWQLIYLLLWSLC